MEQMEITKNKIKMNDDDVTLIWDTLNDEEKTFKELCEMINLEAPLTRQTLKNAFLEKMEKDEIDSLKEMNKRLDKVKRSGKAVGAVAMPMYSKNGIILISKAQISHFIGDDHDFKEGDRFDIKCNKTDGRITLERLARSDN